MGRESAQSSWKPSRPVQPPSRRCRNMSSQTEPPPLIKGWGVTRQTCWEGKDIAEEYQSVRRWFLNLNKRSTVNYRVYMRKFIHYSQLNPDQFLDLARRDPAA